MRRACVLVCSAACFTSTPPRTTPVKQPPAGVFTIKRDSVGPLDANSTATLVGLRALFVGYEVKPLNDGSLQYDVWFAGERLLFVVPHDDRPNVFNVHAVSSKVDVEGRDWRVGRTFGDSAKLTRCECWGPNPTCYVEGEHVAVNFDRSCDGLADGENPRALDVLDGVAIQRVIWSPTPFGADVGDHE